MEAASKSPSPYPTEHKTQANSRGTVTRLRAQGLDPSWDCGLL